MVLGVVVVGRSELHWPLTYWPVYSTREDTLPPRAASRLDLRVTDSSGRVHPVELTRLFDQSRTVVAQTAIQQAFLVPAGADRERNRAYLARALADAYPELDITAVEAWRREWTVDPLQVPPLDRDRPRREIRIDSFKTPP
jgi:hypothetical protein